MCLHRVHDGFLVQLGANITPRALRRRVTRAAAPRADLGHGAVAHPTDRRALPKADGQNVHGHDAAYFVIWKVIFFGVPNVFLISATI